MLGQGFNILLPFAQWRQFEVYNIEPEIEILAEIALANFLFDIAVGCCKQADIDVYLSDKMIHSKLMLIDDEVVIVGSANISVFSMQKAVELDVVVKDNPEFIKSVKATIDQRLSESTKVQSIAELTHYNRVIASLQQLHQLLT